MYPLALTWCEEYDQFCEQNNVFLQHPITSRGVYEAGEAFTIYAPMRVESFGTLVKHHFFSVGAYTFTNHGFPPGVTIGRYGSVAISVEIMRSQHPLKRFTTSPITALPRWAPFAEERFGKPWSLEPFEFLPPDPIIGNDVWIGQQALLKGGITIGDGAVIGSRAVVTRDVPPYAIVAGVPARVIRYRFPEQQIERLLSVRWWEFNYPDLPQENWTDIDRFLDALEDSCAAGRIERWFPPVWDLGIEFLRISKNEDHPSSNIDAPT